jgi:hypothetical protein
MRHPLVLLTIVLALGGLWAKRGVACPFCNAVSQTFAEEIAAMDVVVIARLVEAPPAEQTEDATVSPDPRAAPTKSKFHITEMIKGQEVLGDSRTLETLFFGDPNLGATYLIMGADPPDLMWSSPFEISERVQQYLRRVIQLPEGAERLEFFLRYLEDEDEVLTRDAYDEFARAAYEDVKKLKEKVDHAQLVSWIQDPDVTTSHRRLYLTLLGVCGGAEDLPMLEQMLRSDQPLAKEGRDALVACYLLLKGPEGLPLVEELFLTNEQAEYVDTYATIMALRFHGTEVDVIPRDRLLESLRHVLDRPELADLVIADLARWEDWSVMDRLVELFQKADDQSSWVRVPVVNYLRACPLPEAEQHIAALREIDPDAVKRANTFFPFAAAPALAGNEAEPADDPSADVEQAAAEVASPAEPPQPEAAQPEASGVVSAEPGTADPAVEAGAAEAVQQERAAETSEAAAAAPEQVAGQDGSEAEPTDAAADGPSPEEASAAEPVAAGRTLDTAPLAQEAMTEVNVVTLLGLALLLGIILLIVMWVILRGTMVGMKR